MSTKIFTTLTILSIFVLISCNPQYGVVVDKVYEPLETYVKEDIYITKGTLDSEYRVNINVIDQEDYILILKCGTEVYVMPKLWHSLDSGDVWRRTKDCNFKDKNNILYQR